SANGREPPGRRSTSTPTRSSSPATASTCPSSRSTAPSRGTGRSTRPVSARPSPTDPLRVPKTQEGCADSRIPVGRNPAVGARRGAGSGCDDGLDLEGDADLVAHEHAAGLQGGVPGEVELLAGDLGLGGEADAGGAEGVGGRAVVLDLEGGGLGHAVDGEVA